MKLRFLFALFLIASMLSGCASGIMPDSGTAPFPGLATTLGGQPSPGAKEEAPPSGKVTVWSYYSGADWIIPVLQARYPELDIEVKTISWDVYETKYLSAVDNGSAPDVLLADNNMLINLAGLNVFENVSADPYDGEKLAGLFSEEIISPYRSIESNELFGLPLDIGPAVAYYRHDLFEKAGLPSEPEELSRYMEDPANWLAAAKKLKEQGSAIAFSEWDPIWMTQYSAGYFDRNLNYARDTASFALAIRLAREIRGGGLASNLNLYSKEGRTSLNNGSTAMLYNGWWFRNELKNAAPDTSGLWRIMRLPFGLYGWAGSAGAFISSTSDNKAGAWAVVSTLAGTIAEAGGKEALGKGFGDEGDPFYGGQQTQLLYADLIRNMPSFTPTPLDTRAEKIWKQFVFGALDNDTAPEDLLAHIRQLTMDSLRTDLRLLQEAAVMPPGQ